jgi:hypothetical protein
MSLKTEKRGKQQVKPNKGEEKADNGTEAKTRIYTSLGSSCVVSRSANISSCLNAVLSSKFNFASAATSLLLAVSARGFI